MARLPTFPQVVLATALVGLGCTGNIGDTGPVDGVPSYPGSGPGSGSGPGGATAPPRNSAPGVAQLRRLTVLEYRNTVRDLLGLTDVQVPDLSGDQQAMTSGYTTGAAI